MRCGYHRIVIVGGGFGGIYTALALEKEMRHRRDLHVTLLNHTNYFLYYPLIPEILSGGVEPRHAVVPLRTLFHRVTVLEADVQSVDFARRAIVAARGPSNLQETISYDQLVLAVGAEANLQAFPSVSPVAFPFKTAEDAIALHNQLVECLEAAEFCQDEAMRSALLTFVVVGGGSTGVECLGEMEAFLEGALNDYPALRRHDLRLVLVEKMPRILAEVGPELGNYALDRLQRRGIEVHLGVSVQSATPEAVTLSNGTRIPSRTLVWTIGLAPSRFLATLPVPKTAKGWIAVEATMAVPGFRDVWALGDAAKIPSPDGAPYPPTAQHAVREARRLAENMMATIEGRPATPYGYHPLGTVVSIGGQQGVASIEGRPLKGFAAWLLWRAVHITLLPGVDRKLRVFVDWLFSRRQHKDLVQIGIRRPIPNVPTPAIAFLRETPASKTGAESP